MKLVMHWVATEKLPKIFNLKHLTSQNKFFFFRLYKLNYFKLETQTMNRQTEAPMYKEATFSFEGNISFSLLDKSLQFLYFHMDARVF